MATITKKVKTKYLSCPKEIGANDKCPPQAKLILDTIKANAVDGKIKRDDLVNLLKRPPEEGGLKTNQTAERILGFYKPRLTESGVLLETEEEVEVQVEVADKSAKAEKEATGGESTKPAKQEKHKKGGHKETVAA